MNFEAIISLLILGLGYFLMTQWKNRQDHEKIQGLWNFNLRPSKKYQFTPKVSVKPLKKYKISRVKNLPVIETPVNNTKTLIINCNEEKQAPVRKIEEWSLDFTPSLSNKIQN